MDALGSGGAASRVRAACCARQGVVPWAMGGAPAGGPRRSSRPKRGDLRIETKAPQSRR